MRAWCTLERWYSGVLGWGMHNCDFFILMTALSGGLSNNRFI